MACRSAASASSQSAASPKNFGGRVASSASKSSKPKVRRICSTKASRLASSSCSCSAGQKGGEASRQRLGGAEDVRLALGAPRGPQQAVDHARLLVPVHRAELEQPQR